MNEKLLIVDDEKGVVDMLKSYFEMQSFVVYTAYDGETALKQAACHPDLVLLDINMPGMDGLTVCEKIRSHISCPILFLTARIETADKIKGFQVGADDYIIKQSRSSAASDVYKRQCGGKTESRGNPNSAFSLKW